jgi:N-dimethylarginine dimethylaminohydrolase
MIFLFSHFSARTNIAGYKQFRSIVEKYNGKGTFTVSAVPVHDATLHLKSCASYLEDGIFVVDPIIAKTKFWEVILLTGPNFSVF